MVAKQNFSDSPASVSAASSAGVAHTVVSADSAWTDAPHSIIAANAHGKARPAAHTLVRQARCDIVHGCERCVCAFT